MSASPRWLQKVAVWAASRWWGLFLVPPMVGFCVVTGLMLLQLRRDAWQHAVQGAASVLAAVSQDVTRNVELYDLSLQAVCDGVENASMVALPPALRQDALFDRAATARHFGTIEVLDAAGNLTYSSAAQMPARENLSARDYFASHRDRPSEGLLVSGPDRRADGSLALTLSRRISHPDGSFAGVAAGTLGLGYFHDLFDQLHFAPGSTLSLFRTDGTLVARSPWNDAVIGRNIGGTSTFRQLTSAPHGVLDATSAIDGQHRTYSFTRLSGLPLILDVAVENREIFAPWRRQAAVTGGAVALLCLAGILLGVLLNRALRRRSAAEGLIRRSETQYRLLADNCTDLIMRVNSGLVRTYVSPASLPLLGYAPEEMLGGRNRDILHPNDYDGLFARVREAQRSRQPAEAAYRLRRKDGDYVWVEGRYSFVPEDGGFIIVLRDIARRKAAELELERAHAELARLATSDGLTGLANRRCFDERLIQEWRRTAREEAPLSLVLLDVDQFKRFNDRYGHPAGDRCLRAVAQAVAGSVRRPGDLVARYGGEELVLLLPGTDQPGLTLLAERLRATVEALGIVHEDNGGCGVVTVSIGAATVLPSGHEADDGAQLLALADAALYEAKRGGRNRVVTSGPATREPVPPPAPDEPARLRTLAEYDGSGATEPSPELDEITRLAARLFDVPNAFLNVIDAQEHRFISAVGPRPNPIPRSQSPCAHVVAGRGPMVVADARMDPRFSANPLVTAPEGMRFYAGAPLVSPMDGQPLGALCVVDTRVRPGLDASQIALLGRLAGLAAAALDTRRQAACLPVG